MYSNNEIKELLDYHNITDEEFRNAIGKVWVSGCSPNFQYFRVDVHDAIEKVIKENAR